jgi:response regulator RpfG family c-di-GMP phosphodiesterase
MLSSKKVLLVDDEEDIIELIQDTISFDFQKADSAQTVDDAIKLVDSNVYDCIIVDLNINNINGAVLIKHIQSNIDSINSNAAIIIISGFVDQGFKDKYTGRFFGIVPKPFEVKSLLSLIKSATSWEAEQDKKAPVRVDTPFKVPDLTEKVKTTLNKIKDNPKLDSLFKELKVNRDKDNYIKTHTGLSINIACAVASVLHWGSDATFEKVIFAADLKETSLTNRPDLVMLWNKDEILTHPDAQIILDHPRMGSKLSEDYPAIPEDVPTMILSTMSCLMVPVFQMV